MDNIPKNVIPYIKQVIDGIKNRTCYGEHGGSNTYHKALTDIAFMLIEK